MMHKQEKTMAKQWQKIQNSNFFYNSSRPLNQETASEIFIARSNFHSSLLAVKFYSQKEQPNPLIQDLINTDLPNVISFKYAHFQHPAFVVMEHCGSNLKKFLTESSLQSQGDKILLAASQIIKGLEQLQEKQIIHGDVKAENVVISKQGVLKLCDLDYSLKQNQASGKQIRIGTFQYMAPEVLEAGRCSYKSDIWSLGLLLYEMFFGHLPWNLPIIKTLNQKAFHNYCQTIKQQLVEVRQKIAIYQENAKDKSVALLMEMILDCLQLDPANRTTLGRLSLVCEHHVKISGLLSNRREEQKSNYYDSIGKAACLQLFQQLNDFLDAIPSNDMILKKTKDLSDLLKQIVKTLQTKETTNTNELIDKFCLQSKKVCKIIQNNIKRLGTHAKLIDCQKKNRLAASLEAANVFLEDLALQKQINDCKNASFF